MQTEKNSQTDQQQSKQNTHLRKNARQNMHVRTIASTLFLCLLAKVAQSQTSSVPTQISPSDWRVVENWQQLKKGMSAQEVKSLIGEPEEKRLPNRYSTLVVNWKYPAGQATFNAEQLVDWQHDDLSQYRPGNAKSTYNWNRLQRGIAKDSVRKYLGAPTRISTPHWDGSVDWVYDSTGVVTFEGSTLTKYKLEEIRQEPKVETIFLAESAFPSVLSKNKQPRYPSVLLSAGIPGEVNVSFEIDTLGRTKLETIKIVRTSHQLFSDSVKDFLASVQFEPISVGDKRARIVAQKTFTFGIR